MPWSDFFDFDGLSGEGNAEVDLLVAQAKTSAAGDHYGAVAERIQWFGNASIRSRGGRVDLNWAFHRQSFMRPYLIDILQESVGLRWSIACLPVSKIATGQPSVTSASTQSISASTQALMFELMRALRTSRPLSPRT